MARKIFEPDDVCRDHPVFMSNADLLSALKAYVAAGLNIEDVLSVDKSKVTDDACNLRRVLRVLGGRWARWRNVDLANKIQLVNAKILPAFTHERDVDVFVTQPELFAI